MRNFHQIDTEGKKTLSGTRIPDIGKSDTRISDTRIPDIEKPDIRKPDSANKRQIGGKYEQAAADYLRAHGMEILEQNYRSRKGEIDLIGRDGSCLVFVEVKYRKNRKKGDPLEAVTQSKRQRIRQTAQIYLYTHRYGADTPCRFDVVSILDGRIGWIQDAF